MYEANTLRAQVDALELELEATRTVVLNMLEGHYYSYSLEKARDILANTVAYHLSQLKDQS